MSYVNTNIRMDSEVKRQAQELFANLGFDISQAVNLLLQQAIANQTIMEKPLVFNQSGVKQAKLGGWEGKVWMSDDFDEPLEEFKEYMQ